MSPAALSIFIFGVYLSIGGLALIFVPDWVCVVLKLPTPDPLWVRISGMFFLDVAFYCFRAAREENTSFMRWSVLTRPCTLLFLSWFVIMGYGSPILLAFGIIDVMASTWTAWALRLRHPL